MRAPDDLDTVAWANLTHAYGGADDVPALIRALYDPGAADDALDELAGSIWHQGDVFPATVEAVPFLAHAAAHGCDSAGVLRLLAAIADQPPGDRGVPVVAAVARAVTVAANDLLPAARHPEAGVRSAYARLAATLPVPAPAAVLAELAVLEAGDPDPEVRADALLALAVHRPEDASRERAVLTGGAAVPKLAAAMLSMRRAGPPYPADAVEAVAAGGDRPRDDAQRADIAELLIEEPDTAFAVAARWIDAGDHDCNGTGLVAKLHRTWRDHDHRTVRLLTRAPVPDTPNRLRLRIVDLAAALDRLPGLPADTRQLLTTAAAHADRDLRHAALRCLARWGAVPPDAGRLPPAVLAALPDKEPVVEAIRGTLAFARGNDAIALVEALEPAVAERLLPELLALAARNTAGIVVARQFAVIPSAAADSAVTAALTSAMRSPVEMQRAAAAASWLVLGHPPAMALDVFRTLLTGGDRPDWYLIEVARAAAPLPELVTPLLGSDHDWTRVRAAVAHHRITGGTGPAAAALAAVLGEPGSRVLPVHADAVEALAALEVLPPEAAGRIREFRDSVRRLDRDPVLDERLRDAARRLLLATRSG